MISVRTLFIPLLVIAAWLFPGPGIVPSEAIEPASSDEGVRTLADYEPIRDYLHQRLCRFYEKETEIRRGAECYEALDRAYPDSPLRAGALFQAAKLYRETGELQHSRDLFTVFLRDFPDDRQVPEVWAGLGLIAYEEGRYLNAGDAFRKIRVQYPAASPAEAAGKYLNEIRKEIPTYPQLTSRERLQRAGGLYQAEAYRKAADEYREIIDSGKLRGKDREEALFSLARSHDLLREWDAASNAYQSYLKRYPDGRHTGEALFRSGRVALKRKKDDDYLKVYRRYLRKYPAGKYRDEIRYGMALFYEDRGDVEKAKAALDRILDTAPNGEWGTKALWEKGWIAYRRGAYAEAVHLWDRLARRPDAGYRDMALYWQGRSLERLGQPEPAEDRFRSLCDQYPHAYYCLAATGEILLDAEPSMPDYEAAGEILPELPAEITRHPRYPRIEALARVGWPAEAAREARSLRMAFEQDPNGLLALAYLLYRLGDTPHTLDILQSRFSREIAQGGMETNLPFRLMAFPRDYADRIAAYADPLGVDPALAAALIREESWFNPKAVSPVGALGLMQVMPATAKRILAAAPDPPSSSGTVSPLLVDPEWNIRLGVRFLADMLARFDGEIVFAVAAYNAGPGAVDRWIRTIPAETPDEFIESIPYPETRQYVKRVLRSYAEYRRTASPGDDKFTRNLR